LAKNLSPRRGPRQARFQLNVKLREQNGLRPPHGWFTIPSGIVFANQGTAAMKKKPASTPEIPKTAAKPERARMSRAAMPATPAAESEPKKTKPARTARKPLLDVAMDTVKK